MRILVSHLTRMRGMRICVAGLSNQNAHVRPIPRDLQLVRSQIPDTWALGGTVELGATNAIGAVPRLEDREFTLADAKKEAALAPDLFFDRLTDASEESLNDIFGSDFKVNPNRKGYVAVGHGEASLGILSLQSKPTLYDDFEGNPRLRFTDGEVEVDCSITDVRLRRSDNVSLNAAAVVELRARIRDSEAVLLSVGLTHPYPPMAPKHWLQVNNVHCSADPLWRA